MSINDLDLILKKDPIISTWPARSLYEQPEDVEKDYLVHSRTHLSLGDTAKYVDTIFKWVSGINKGTFVGAVLGDYGEGKTSFLLHVWAQSRERQVFAVPPFEWNAFEQIVDAIAGWIQYVLKDTHLELARRIQHVHDEFRQQTNQDLARTIAKSGQDYDSVLETIEALVSQGMTLPEMSAARLLDFVAEATPIVREAGYKGLLTLLDEPEVAAKKLSGETVQHFLFDLANELHRRQGNYGVFLSMPGNFFASAQRRFSALPARLEVRKCFPRLGDIYGLDFAEVLWSRYVKEFELGEQGHNLVSPLALQAIGQVGSSDHRELSYGPRSVVSAFRRMVDHYLETSTLYEPQHFVQDVLEQEILVKPKYRSEILTIQRSPDINDENRESLMLLAAFPAGLRSETLRELGFEEVLRPLARSGGLVYRTAFTMGLRALRSRREGSEETDLLRDLIEEIDSEYAPDRRAFDNALSAFVHDVVPLVFQKRKGQQLVGWQVVQPMKETASGVRFGTMMGAFQQMSRNFPHRAIMLLASSLDASWKSIEVPKLDVESGPQQYDLFFHFALRWHADQEQPGQMTEISEPEGKPALIRLHIDLGQGTIHHDYFAELVGADRMTPLWVLNLLQRMRKVTLPREFEAEWTSLREMLLRRLQALFLGNELNSSLAQTAEAKLQERVTGSGLILMDRVSNLLLRRRYPEYETLIRQRQWQSRVDDYINALTSSEVPLVCKRERELWKVEGDQEKERAARVLGTSRANLNEAFNGFESLIEITIKGKYAPLKVAFHIHPLEQEIRDLICSQPTGADRKLKREGKECWYMPISDLLPVILKKGYTVEELQKVVEIGKARQTFEETERRRERVLYCIPLDPDELKAQLRAKLSDLVAEINEYKQLSDYVTRFDPTVMEEDIEKVEDDADYDKLMTLMNKEFVQNHSRLPGYFALVQEKLQRVRKQVKDISDRLLNSREVKQLALPSATSPWGAALGRYIVPNLQHGVDEFRKDSEALFKQLDEKMMRFTYSQQRMPQENLMLLREAWSEANDDESRGNTLRGNAQNLLQQLADFGHWGSLLKQSDQVYARLLDLQKDPEHQAKAKELIGTFDNISQEIADHLELRNVTGLSVHRQYLKRFEELEKTRQQYLTSLKGSFDKLKDKVNQFLMALNLDGRVSVVFNPSDIVGCYDQLFSEGASLVDERALERALTEMATQERELKYARDILRLIEHESAASLLADLKGQQQAVETLKGEVNQSWLRGLIEDDNQIQIQHVAQEIAVTFDTVRATRQTVRQLTTPSESDSGRVQKMYEVIPEHQAIDLKDLVLQMMTQLDDPSQALEVSLDGLADLFRRNCIQINVERRHR
ncbi:MAG: hypothetical protein E3J21_11775 [Anaerolineales bacterium]|nr:MAG: hypothetical protein E3J21_11775 [Anaerolineales bacterium]